MEDETLCAGAVRVLETPGPADKARATRALATAWRSGRVAAIGHAVPPKRPARPSFPELKPPRQVPRRAITTGTKGRVALLHALAHIELNAIDLAWDILARFAGPDLPEAFYADWLGVADDEARHFEMLSDRLSALGAAYGDLPAHDGLWQSAAATAHDLAARLAVVPMVLEARGLDVTPAMVAKLEAVGDRASAAVLQSIHDDEIGHVAVGRRWFQFVCGERGLDPAATFQNLVRAHFKGQVKPPFNHLSRERAGLPAAYYEPLAAG